MKAIKASHFFTEFYSLGGVQNVLRHHRANDVKWQIDANFVIYSESEREPVENVHFLGVEGSGTIANARKKLSHLLAKRRPELAVYHGMWGLENLGDLDGAERRMLLLHGETPALKDFIQYGWKWVDGILCVSEPLQKLVRSYIPQFPTERVGLLPYPISPPSLNSDKKPIKGRPLVIGFCSRVQFEQKRVDRLPELCRLLDKTGVDYRLEILGDGSEMSWLRDQVSGNSKVIFHGRQSGERYWQILNSWDAILFVSDYEGLPIAMLEALSLGVIPIYPDINSGGDLYARRIAAQLVYPAGDLSGAVREISSLAGATESEIAQLRARCRDAAAPHVGSGYMETFSKFAAFVLESPRISTSNFPTRNPIVDNCPHQLLLKGRHVRNKLKKLVGR